MAKFRKKPVVIDAVQWTGSNIDDIKAFVGDSAERLPLDGELVIHTLEGTMHAALNDWIIRGVSGEHYPCKPDIFAVTYEAM